MDTKVDESEHFVFENYHEAIIDYKTWAYTCGTYHKRGLKGCTSHHIRVDFLDKILKEYVKLVRDDSKDMIKEIAKADEDTVEIIEETYAEIEEDLLNRIKGLQNQINLSVDKRNDIIRINRLVRTVIDIFDDILIKKNLDKKDLEFLIDKIIVFEDRIHVKLKADIDNLLKAGVVTTFYY